MKSKSFTFACLLAAGSLYSGCTTEEVIEQILVVAPSETTLAIDARFGNADFEVKKDLTAGANTYNFDMFRYWLSNISLVTESGAEHKIPDGYYLMEEVTDLNLSTINDGVTYPAKKREEVVLTNVPAGRYKTVKFSIGVDSRYNNNLSLQAGELSIANGMSNVSWMWHTSYIFSSLSGKVFNGSTNAQAFLAETGLNENYRSVSVELSTPLVVDPTKPSKLKLNLDVAKVLENVDVVANPTINAGKPEKMEQLANNLSRNAFSFNAVE